MSKVQKISEIAPTLPFTEYDFYESYKSSFQKSELGKLHQSFPLAEISNSLKLKASQIGRKNFFSPQSKVALMILKAHTRFSDRELIEHLNGNIHFQLFCGVSINPQLPLSNFKIISAIRCEIAKKMKIKDLEKILASHWKPYLTDLQVMMTDATCYTSDMRNPTDPKLLWESVYWVYKELRHISKSVNIRMPRSKYIKQTVRYSNYSRKRKRSVVETRVLKRSLLHLLDKLLTILKEHISTFKEQIQLTPRFYKRFSTISKVLTQQQILFVGGVVKDRIVSLDKDYIHPIVRGKERIAVEYGAKVNAIQVGGLNFIQRLSWSAFNECKELKNSVEYAQILFRKKIKMVAADRIYATNENRRYCSQHHISTSFIRKGRAGEDEAQKKIIRSILSKERATRLEGSFGTEKEKYNLTRIKARTKSTEMLWIFFGVHTANAVRMIPKMFDQRDALIERRAG